MREGGGPRSSPRTACAAWLRREPRSASCAYPQINAIRVSFFHIGTVSRQERACVCAPHSSFIYLFNPPTPLSPLFAGIAPKKADFKQEV